MDRAGPRHRSRIAITGIGAVSPAGGSAAETVDGLIAGRSTVGPVTRYETAHETIATACEVQDEVLEGVVSPRDRRRHCRASLLGTTAGIRAVESAGLQVGGDTRTAVVVGTGMGGLDVFEVQSAIFRDRGPDRMSPLGVPMVMSNAIAANLAFTLGWSGVAVTYAMACSSGAFAIAEGARYIRDGQADVVLCGGAESLITPSVMGSFSRAGAMSGRAGPARCRPFDAQRDGFVMGEGAGFVVLEAWEAAVARGASIHGEVLGWGANTDIHHITAPSPDGAPAIDCMQMALADAGLEPADIRHVSAHGTATLLNDVSEALALQKVFGDGGPPLTAPKGSTGHMLGASGAVEAIAAVLCADRGVVPPVVGLEELDPEVGPIDAVIGTARTIDRGPALSNSFAFGGHNVTLVVGPPDATTNQ